jgi:hypothetical protein
VGGRRPRAKTVRSYGYSHANAESALPPARSCCWTFDGTFPGLSWSFSATVSAVCPWSAPICASMVTLPPTVPDAVKSPEPSIVPTEAASTAHWACTGVGDPFA